MSNFRIGEGDLRKLVIRSNTSSMEMNIANITTALSIYEDLFSQHMSCNIHMVDGTNLQNSLPIVGGEKVQVDFGIPGENKNIRRLKNEFVVFSLNNREKIGPDAESYMLGLTTPENLVDATTSVERAYMKPVHEIVQNVVDEFLTPITGKKLLTIDPTKGILKVVSTSLTVNAFIHQLCKEAESIEHPSSLYYFYETSEGYHFESMDNLYAGKVAHTFVYDDVVKSDIEPGASQQLQNIISNININNSFNLLHGQIGGQFNNHTDSFDPLTKTYRQTSTYEYDKHFMEGVRTTPQDTLKNRNKMIVDKTYQKYFNSATATNYIATDSHRSGVSYITKRQPETQNVYRRRQDFLAKEKSAINQYGTMRLHFSIPGNPMVSIGQNVNIILPRGDDSELGRKLNDKFISGKYLITAVAHNFSPPTGKYATVVECMRNGYQEEIA